MSERERIAQILALAERGRGAEITDREYMLADVILKQPDPRDDRIAELEAEVSRLTKGLNTANANHEKYERKYYLELDAKEAAEARVKELELEREAIRKEHGEHVRIISEEYEEQIRELEAEVVDKKAECEYADTDLELADLRAENERLQQELTKTRRKLTIYRTALANAKIRARDLEKQAINNMESWLIVSHKATALQQELKATEASWSNAELREAALRKRIAESPVVCMARSDTSDDHWLFPLRLNPGESCRVRLAREEKK